MSSSNPYQTGLDKNPANYVPLSPISFLERAARVFPDHTSIIHGETRYTWSQTYQRALRLASALRHAGVKPGDTVSVIAPNIPAIFEAHFGVPMCGAVLNTLNTRLDANTIAFILDHGECRILITDSEYASQIGPALAATQSTPQVIDIIDPASSDHTRLGDIDYESFLASGDPAEGWQHPDDEWDAISLNYTSGTTGNPKGVVYHHRGAYLNAMSNVLAWNMNHHPTYLWTLPMFHCNGWCFPWTLAALAGTSICMRKVSAGGIFAAIDEHRVTHLCGAPIVLNMIINASDEERRAFDYNVNVMTAAAPPPATVLTRMEQAGFSMTHVYGLTETYGPAVICAWHDSWNALPDDERARKKARQGVAYPVLEGLDVMDGETMTPVPANGQTMGETMFRGNIVMKGYLKNPQATAEAFAGGWFHSGDLGVMGEDSYLTLKDRSKDIIISGGENISSIEVEDILYRHPCVIEAAVVARPDNHWGETPCAFIALKSGADISEQEIIDFCRENLAHYKCPRTVVFQEVPKTSTGKVQKFKLREQAQALGSLS
ncbi:MAG: acyl-CoA synthetase [marine bacterium B5-7]|nr:MAG: acyl-CoA synthetase [marine bacterium B5-7]